MSVSLGQELINLDIKGDYIPTHVSMIEPKCKVSLGRQEIGKFFEIYSSKIENEIAGIAEIPNKVIPIYFDIDLKKSGGSEEFLYTELDVKETVNIIQDKLLSLIPNENLNLTTIVLTKMPYIKDGYIKHGFHLHMPYIILDTEHYTKYLFSGIENEIDDIFCHKVENGGKIVDNCSKKPWLMYGSQKDIKSGSYRANYCLDNDRNKIELEDGIKSHYSYTGNKTDIYKILSLHNFHEEYYHSINSSHIELVREINKLPKEYPNKVYSLEEVRNYVNMIDPHEGGVYDIWIKIGWALFSIGDGCLDMFELWDSFSQKTASYDRAELKRLWDGMYAGKYTIGTLKYYARNHNEEMYLEYQKLLMKQDIAHIRGTDNEIAEILHKRFGEEVVSTSMSGRWYQFKNHVWERIEDAICLRKRLNMMSKNYLEEEAKYSEEILAIENTQENKTIRDLYKQKKAHAWQMAQKLGSNNFKNSIIREAREVFYDKSFEDKLDNNPYLIAFENGVYDLKEHRFREGRPDDYISKKMPIKYRKFDKSNKYYRECEDFLEKVFPNEEVRKYFVDTTADLFIGGNFRKIALFWTGDGNNGKSVTEKIIFDMFGFQYMRPLPSSLLTDKKQKSSGCNPDVYQLIGGVRGGIAREIDQTGNSTTLINTGALKELTGNDYLYARDIHQKGEDMKPVKPMFQIIIVVNDLPGMTGDEAVWNRVRVIPFQASFSFDKNVPKSLKEQRRRRLFPADPNFNEKIPYMLEPFAFIFLEHLRTRTELMAPPRDVMAITNEYRKRNDIYQQFLDDMVVEVADKTKIVKIGEIFQAFLMWYDRSGVNTMLKPSQQELMKFMKNKLGKPYQEDSWKGFILREDKDANDNRKFEEMDEEEKIEISCEEEKEDERLS